MPPSKNKARLTWGWLLSLGLVAGCGSVSRSGGAEHQGASAESTAPLSEPVLLRPPSVAPLVRPRQSTSESVSGDDSMRLCGEVRWCASGGAALVGSPVLDERERVYVATSDGYLHAFEKDGRFRFSYTVKGTPLGSVSLRSSDGVILMGTTAGLIYAINQSGRLHFRHSTPTSVWSGLYALNDHAVTFLGLDWRLYALRNSGAALYRVRAPSPPTTEPVVAPGDVVWVGMAGAVARFVAAYRLQRLPLSADEHITAPVEQIVTLGEVGVARASGQAYWLSSDQSPIELGAVTQLGGDASRVAAVKEGEEGFSLQLLRSRKEEPTSELVHQRILPEEIDHWDLGSVPVSGEVTISGQRILLPRSDGTLAVYHGREPLCSLSVSSVPLQRAVVGRSGETVILSDRSGQFCAVTLKFP